MEDPIRHGPTLLPAEADVSKRASQTVREGVSEARLLGEAQLAELEKPAVKGAVKSYSIYEKDFGALPPEEEAILNSLKSRGLVIEEPLGVTVGADGAVGYDEYAYYLTDVGHVVYQLWQGTKGG